MSISFFFQGIWYLDKLRRLPGVFEKIARLRKARQLPQDVLAQQQFNALRTLLRHAYDTTRHYRESMDHVHIHPDDIRELVDFRSVPILRKRDIQEDLESLVSRRVPKASLVQDTTGGSTGEPLIFYHDAVTREWFEACDAFVLDSWGVKPWAKKAFLWGADRDIPEMTCRERLRLALERSSFLNSFAMSEEKMAEYARFLMDWRPDYLQGYASSLYLFARFLLGNDLLVPQPNAVRSSAETLYDHQREAIQQAFGNALYNFYGSREIPNIAFECSAHQGLHTFFPLRVVEIVDSRGGPVSDGTIGKILITDLVNYSMPFIRYEIGDVGVKCPHRCPCGCTFPLLEGVKGRESDFLQTPDGQYVHGEFFTHLFYGVKGVEKFQVYQHNISSITVSLVQGGDIPSEQLDEILQQIREKMGKDVWVKMRFVDTIPVPESGKHRFTLSDVPPRFQCQN